MIRAPLFAIARWALFVLSLVVTGWIWFGTDWLFGTVIWSAVCVEQLSRIVDDLERRRYFHR